MYIALAGIAGSLLYRIQTLWLIVLVPSFQFSHVHCTHSTVYGMVSAQWCVFVPVPMPILPGEDRNGHVNE